MLELVARARDVRQAAFVDSAFQSYRADARGYVYFYIDREDTAERTLVRADQIAIEMYWLAPDETRQRIVGLRDEEVLPTNIRYHLDHLTVVQDDFADVIRLGDGDEVSAVTHPVAPLAERVYDFRLADSLTIAFPGAGLAPVRVYEVEVRPRDLDRPGFVGSVFVDRASAAIVRMSFTFTPASYVDPYLDYIRISLDNSLWDGRYWLPYRQEAELRREMPQLDFLAGTVIRGRFEIGAYDINAEVPGTVLRTTRVSAAPPEERTAFPFERGLFEQLDEEGLAAPPSLEEVEARARRMVQDRYLSGLSRLRLSVPAVSEIVRYDRAEGLFLGAGATFRPSQTLRLRARAGWAFAASQISAAAELTGEGGRAAPGFAAYANDLRDLGPLPGRPGALNSIVAALGGSDDLDPFFATGARTHLPLGGRGPLALALQLSVERQRSARLEVVREDDPFRPVRPVREGDRLAGDLVLETLPGSPSPWRTEARLRAGSFDGQAYGAAMGALEWARDAAWREVALLASFRAGAVTSEAPAQELFLLGGRGTLLGHPQRAFVGDRFWLTEARATRELLGPFLSAGPFVQAGQASLESRPLPEGWTGDGDAGVKATVGVGLGLAWNVVRLDVGRALGDGGGWGFHLTAARRFLAWL